MKAKLKTLKRGQTFYGAGIQWLVLGHTNSSQGLPHRHTHRFHRHRRAPGLR